MIVYSEGDEQIQGIRSDGVPEELWTEVHRCTRFSDQNYPKKKKCKKAKRLSEEALQIAEERRQVKSKWEK